MSGSASTLTEPAIETVGPDDDDFDLNIETFEVGGGVISPIELTNNGCGSTCASPCATNVG